jgi:LysM repeat protein
MEDLTAANESLQKNLNKLRDEVQRLSDEVTRANDKSKDAAMMESIKALKAAIEEVDKKRMEDQRLVVEKLDAFKKLLDKPVTVPRTAPVSGGSETPTAKPPKRGEPAPTPHNTDSGKPETGYNYSIQDGDYLAKIVSKLNKQGIKVSQKQIMDANPGVAWNKLKVNQVIFIPAPQP